MRLFSSDPYKKAVQQINQLRAALHAQTDTQLREFYQRATTAVEVVAAGAAGAWRVLGQDMFDVQLRGSLALIGGKIAEMQTGEGKTLAAAPAALWYARQHEGVHVMTFNDYLARRDAAWMGGIYRLLGVTVGAIQQDMKVAERRDAYRADITYATATELGFDYLRDGMALELDQQVHRAFHSAVIDEADSILIDEARIPLVIAGGKDDEDVFPLRADAAARHLHFGIDFVVQESNRNVTLTDFGIQHAEQILRAGNLYREANLPLLAALQNAIHAHTLLRRDVDYIVKDGKVVSVDEWKGRVVLERRWPAGLHTALEIKEGVATRRNGRILGSITLQNLVALYPEVCGMTGTAASQADEFRKVYGLEVEVIPTNRPVLRRDHPDVLFETKADKEQAVIGEIRRAHTAGQPVLVGTASVAESERLSSLLDGLPHSVLNARNDEEEARIVAEAGQRAAITVSTNMAGRGTDIKLGDGVAALGGLYVIGTNRHEARRIDHQLRGRAGRQGDPGESRFFVSLEDELVEKYGGDNPDEMQRRAEGQNLELRLFLQKYESAIEGQRLKLGALRQAVLSGERPCADERERQITLGTIDNLWSEHLTEVAELRAGIIWVSYAGRNTLYEFLVRVDQWFKELEERLDSEVAAGGADPSDRGAIWTYITHDQAFESLMHRIVKNVKRGKTY
jgi:preprotein translocase subunit SecA